MLIDWFTVFAQVINFLILVWLLKRFLYRPILDAIDAREKAIAAKLTDANEKEAQADQERAQFQHKNEALDQQRETLLKEATEAAQAERQRLLDEARQAADKLGVRRREVLSAELNHLNQSIVRRTRDEVFDIARQTLTDLAATELEERMAAVFVRRLQELDEKSRNDLTAAVAASAARVTIRSTYSLPDPQRAAIQTALSEVLATAVDTSFDTDPELVSGIELNTDGYKLAWNIADYLAQLRTDVDGLVESPQPAAAGPEPEPAESDLNANGA